MTKIIQEIDPQNAIAVLSNIPEFTDPINHQQFKTRLQTNPVILVAYSGKKPVGCKIGYDRFHDGSYYYWLGGVLPEYRNISIAQQLNQKMEELAGEQGCDSIVFKTRNKFKSMLQFGLKNGYNIVGFKEKDDPLEHRIILKKELRQQSSLQ